MEISSSWLLLSFLILLPTALLFLKRARSSTTTSSSSKPTAVGPTALRAYPIIGGLPHFIKNADRLLEFVDEILAASPTATVTVAPVVLTADPAAVEHLTKSNFAAYVKGDDNIDAFRDFLGDGIFNVNGDLWRIQRKTASFEFNAKSLRAFVVDRVRHETAARLLPLLRAAADAARVVDLQDVLERFAFDNVCELVFGKDTACLGSTDGGAEGAKFFHAFEEAGALSVERIGLGLPMVWKIKKRIGWESERRLAESASFVREMASRLVRERRAGGGGGDLLSRFLVSEEQYPDELVRDILISFVLAGRDTTPSALIWFFWALRSNPHVVARIREEIKSIRARFGNAGGDFGLEELREMHYLHAALTESMRLYPPVPLQMRRCCADDVLPDGTRVRRGGRVMYSAYAMGRDRRLWGEDWAEMRPERWLDAGGAFQPASPFKYPVFHAGPRMCLGKDMAYIQMKAVAACVLERFDVEVAVDGDGDGDGDGVGGRYELSFTMRMKRGLPVRVKPISA